MSNDLERLITELEDVTARMLSITCWEQNGRFAGLSALRHELAALLIQRQDLDASAARRVGVVIESGNSLVARIMAMRESLLGGITQAVTQRQLTREIASTVPRQAQAHRVDIQI